MTFSDARAADSIDGMLFSDLIAGPAETLVADLRDYPEWHRGRRRYGVWVLPVEDPALLAYIDAAREQLADLIHPSPKRQAHMTLYVCGFDEAGDQDDDFSQACLEQQSSALQARAGEPCAFPLARLDSFASAAFIPVGDPMHRLVGWRRILGEHHREIRQATYVPHITLGLYRQRVPAAVIRQRLAAVAPPALSLWATELRYVTYAAQDHFGPLSCVRRIVLAPSSEMAAGEA